MPYAIRAEALSKRYRLGQREPYGSLRDSASRFLRRSLDFARARRSRSSRGLPDWIWALDDVSFEVREGEVLGVIGRNGSGKSTLLKILSRITEPTRGRAEVRGRVGSLLEVGTGFHPELTGRENVQVNGAILGMKHQEVERKFDEIVAFADVERFIDTPVKFYSSGMQMRLAFSVAAHLEPEILLVDEVLAVGDLGFQKKCIDKMRDVSGQGRTIVFVSHDLSSVQLLCQRVLRLVDGRVMGMGSVETELAAYMAESRQTAPSSLGDGHPLRDDLHLARLDLAPSPVESGAAADLHVHLIARAPVAFDELAVLIHDALNRRVGVIDFRKAGIPLFARPSEPLQLIARLAAVPLVEGEYRLGVSIRSGNSHQILFDLVTVDVVPRAGRDLSLYRPDIRGMVDFDYLVRVLQPTTP